MLESVMIKKILVALKKQYPHSWELKVHGGPTQARGVPDIIGCLEGYFVALEVKRPGEEATEYQKMQIANIKKAGGGSCIVTSVEEALKEVSDFLWLRKRGR